MRGGRTLSLALVALILGAGAAPLSTAIVPPGPLTTLGVTLQGPEGIGVNIAGLFSGRVNSVASAGVPDATVTLRRGSEVVATLVTGTDGRYQVSLVASTVPGDLQFSAHAETPGATLSGESAPILVKVRARPAPPASVTAVQDGSERRALVSWTATPDTGDAPLLGYRVTRVTVGGSSQVLATVNATTLTLRDDSVGWDRTYRYFVQAITFAGQSAPSAPGELVMPPATLGSLTVRTDRAVVCAPTCNTRAPGDIDFQGSAIRLRPFIGGHARTPQGEGIGGIDIALSMELTVTCAACSPTTQRADLAARSSASGFYEKQPFEHASTGFAIGECRSIRLDDTAVAGAISAVSSATYRFCRTG